MGETASEPTVREGDVLAGRYRLVRLLGEGGMGAVWEARQVTTDKVVALKLLKRREASDVARFLREARLAAALSHRNIVQVFDYWEVEGGGPVFLVMELFEGRTLAERMEGAGPIPLDEVLSVARPVAAALRYAHAQGVVHRDLKPENVFLARTPDGSGATEVKVVDFGLARPTVPDTAATAITQTGAIMGTPYYMAPEQVYGDKDVDGRADVWALGAVLWECLAGCKAFDGENFGQIFKRISRADVRPLAEVARDVPPWLASLVGRMLAHGREDRPTMAEVHDALSHEGAPAKEASAPPPAQAQATVRWPGPDPATPALPVATRLTATTSMRPSVPPA
ncbi:MAG TPA: serine/threonine-protein kinase, partial [Polyangiaceae bacterium]